MTETAAHAPFAAGTPRQTAYLNRLLAGTGFETLVDLCAHHLKINPADLEATGSINAAQASKIIDALAPEAGRPKPAPAPASAGQGAIANLRRLADPALELPTGLDSDARWIVSRLRKLAVIERLLSTDRRPSKGINDGGPILVSQLISFFGSDDSVATAFGVSVQTVKAWGVHLPANRAYEAEVITDGFVVAPRSRTT